MAEIEKLGSEFTVTITNVTNELRNVTIFENDTLDPCVTFTPEIDYEKLIKEISSLEDGIGLMVKSIHAGNDFKQLDHNVEYFRITTSSSSLNKYIQGFSYDFLGMLRPDQSEKDLLFNCVEMPLKFFHEEYHKCYFNVPIIPFNTMQIKFLVGKITSI